MARNNRRSLQKEIIREAGGHQMQPQDLMLLEELDTVDCCVCLEEIQAPTPNGKSFNPNSTVYKCECAVNMCNDCFGNWWTG